MSFLDLAKKRYSCRKISARPVEDEKLQKILEAGDLAPTAHNNQPFHIWLLESAEAMQKVSQTSSAPLSLSSWEARRRALGCGLLIRRTSRPWTRALRRRISCWRSRIWGLARRGSRILMHRSSRSFFPRWQITSLWRYSLSAIPRRTPHRRRAIPSA